jgi:hypothetical protein
MAKTAIPNPLKRRHLIEQEIDSQQCLAIADAYQADGRHFEALQFLVKAGADDRIAALADEAVGSGDAFLLKQVADAQRSDPGPERWAQLAAVADDCGLERYAEMARRHARSSED